MLLEATYVIFSHPAVVRNLVDSRKEVSFAKSFLHTFVILHVQTKS